MIDGVLEPVTEIEEIGFVVKSLIVKMELDPETYFEKRMKYSRDNLNNPKALKVYKIDSSTMGGKTMNTMLGN